LTINEGNRIRVLVVDDQRLMREGIASLLDVQEGIQVVGTAADGEEAVEQAIATQPDIVLMDVRMPALDGIGATRKLLAHLPGCQVLMLTTFDDDEYIVEALRAGAVGYLLKDIPASDLARALHAAKNGIYQLDPAVASKVVAAMHPVSSKTPSESEEGPKTAQAAQSPLKPSLSPLSSREIEVLRLVAQGASNREIAEQLVISEGTVKNHISSILNGLGLRDRTQAAIYAREHGVL
jgi:DNA-binding NarL/FixJ family response regulator